MSKFKCGKCFQGYEALQEFGDHICAGENPVLAAFSRVGVLSLGAYSIDFTKCVEEAVQKNKVERVIESLEDGMRGTDL